jgi:hypothetical protein
MCEQNNGKLFQGKNKIIFFSRVGLVEARVIGARAAGGDVIVVLDAHCECVSSLSYIILISFDLLRLQIGYHHYLLELL